MPTIDLQTLKRATAITGLAVFAIMRDEAYFLPHWLAHYRALGVGFFLIYDDHSTDGTLEYLAAQPDCTVITSPSAFADDFGEDANGAPRRLPQALKETVPDRVLAGRWVLTVDADEFLVLPQGVADLGVFTALLDRIGQPYATAPMVDFYGETLDARHYPAEVAPVAANRWFDVGPYYDWTGLRTPQPFVTGLRMRLLLLMRDKHPQAFAALFGDKATGAAHWKAPLLKHGVGVARVGDHTLSLAPRLDACAALAHFKLYPGLDSKIDQALQRRQYAHASLEYAFLDAARRLMGAEPLVCQLSRRFDGPRSLEEAGLLPSVAHLI